MRTVFALAALLFAFTGEGGQQVCQAADAPAQLCRLRAAVIITFERTRANMSYKESVE